MGITMTEDTFIRLKRTTIELLKALKIHPRQSYDEVINKLIRNLKNK